MVTLTEKEFKQISNYVKSNFGINLSEKANLIEGRLQNILIQKGFNSFAEYFSYIISDITGEGLTNFLNKITTNHTFFLREAEHFNFFRDKVLPQLKMLAKNRDLKIWSAGCSSGEEPYTLAMIIADYFGNEKDQWDTKILATDISHNVLETAMNGVYTNEHIENVPANWKLNYFKKIDNERRVITEKIKTEVIYRHFNLMNDVFPFKSKFHVIFCRNVMIYFDEETKKKLINKFYEYTEPGGYLFIGHSESLGQSNLKYKYVMPAVYRKE